MSRKSIRRAGPEIVYEESVSFNKQPDGYYQKVVKNIERDLVTGTILSTDEIVSTDIYEITTSKNFDHEMLYEDPDGNSASIKFKLVDISDM